MYAAAQQNLKQMETHSIDECKQIETRSINECGPVLFPEAPGYRWHRSSMLAPLFALVSCVLFCCNGELLQALQLYPGGGQPSPLLNLMFCHLGGLFFMPHFLCLTNPPSFAPQPRPIYMNVQISSFFFAMLIMGYNYLWLLSARFVAAGITNAVFQTSVGFVYIASIRIFKEPMTTSQLVGVLLALVGVSLAGGVLSTLPSTASNFTGIIFAFAASLGYTIYQVLFKYMFGHLKNNWRFLAHFGVWVSLWHLLAIFPMIWFASIVGIEPLKFPHGTFPVVGMVVSAIIASTVNALYLCIMMWGSSMLLPCASAISVPLTVMLDIFLHASHPGLNEFLGHILVVISAILILQLHMITFRK